MSERSPERGRLAGSAMQASRSVRDIKYLPTFSVGHACIPSTHVGGQRGRALSGVSQGAAASSSYKMAHDTEQHRLLPVLLFWR